VQSGTESSKKGPKKERPQYTSFFTHTQKKKTKGARGVQKDKASRHSLTPVGFQKGRNDY